MSSCCRNTPIVLNKLDHPASLGPLFPEVSANLSDLVLKSEQASKSIDLPTS